MRGSRDSSEDFVIVSGGESEISFDVVSSVSSDDHTTTFFCLDRVIVYCFLGGGLSLFL